MPSGVQHHYPAALIGQFGTAKKAASTRRNGRDKARRRVVAVARRADRRIYEQTAESLGTAKGAHRLYDLDDPQLAEATLDTQWTRVENRLRELIDALDSLPSDRELYLSADLFLRVLVPLAAQLLVRHPEWEVRYAARVREIHKREIASRIEMNLARNMEYLALCGVLINREWWVVHDPKRRFVSSDLGVAQATMNDDGTLLRGYLWPVSSQTAVFAGAGRDVGCVGRPTVRLRERHVSDAQVKMQNEAVARWAPTVVFGREAALVTEATEIWTRDPTRPEYAEIVPAAILDRDFHGEDIEGMLRAVHAGEQASRPDSTPVPFEKCPGCAYQLAWARAAFPPED